MPSDPESEMIRSSESESESESEQHGHDSAPMVAGSSQDFQGKGLANARRPCSQALPQFWPRLTRVRPRPRPCLPSPRSSLQPCHKSGSTSTQYLYTCPAPGSCLVPVSALTQAEAQAHSLPRSPALARPSPYPEPGPVSVLSPGSGPWG